MMKLALLILLLPLLGFVTNGIFGKKFSKNTVAFIGCSMILISFIMTVFVFINFIHLGSFPVTVYVYDWISLGDTWLAFALYIDQLSLLMMLVITGVGFLIHLYSVSYMKDDENYNRYFSYLNLFIFFMLILVMADNYLMMFAGWEGVGFCSYLLIGFWFKSNEYNNAAKKAFIMNRIGDLGFLLGISLLFITFGSLNFNPIFSQALTYSMSDPVIIMITLLLFIGAIGKSAQVPLYTWLPDAMAGPTPVSALIHAATMVTAGIYLIVRSNILYTLAPQVLLLISIVGAITALTGASIALFQNDIKKVLAYSTVSQLGLIFMGLGAGAYTAAMFHLITHAFFKALLFLCAGSVIHTLHGEQNLYKMGGLKKYLPITYLTFLTGCLAISGIPPFSGFFSKDEILANLYMDNKLLWIIGLLVSVLTAFYMFRLLYLTFFNSFRGNSAHNHLHESPLPITFPLIVLSILSITGGIIGFSELFHVDHFLKGYLFPVLEASLKISGDIPLPHSTEAILMGIAISASLIAALTARRIYFTGKQLPEEFPSARLPKLIFSKYYIDEAYEKIILTPLQALGKLFGQIEIAVIDKFIDSFGLGAALAGNTVKRLQTGKISFYLFSVVIGVITILFFNYLNWFNQ